MKNTWYYYPENKGLITGIILASYGGSPSLINYFSNKIINPNEEKMVNNLYPESVANNVPTFFLYILVTFSIQAVIGILLLFPYKIDADTTNANRKLEYLTVKNIFPKIIFFYDSVLLISNKSTNALVRNQLSKFLKVSIFIKFA